jgi:hypothetical protein
MRNNHYSNNSSSWLITNRTMIDEYCNLKLPVDYDLHWFIAYVSLAFVGLFYTLLGKISFFIT